ncbi:hypothetical protein [Marinicella sp. W31]|uniref:hypothetical protein n=1 Tax=Marinicella sp. W31 TaxID=3023713 RepID=UPI0037584017
MSDEIFNIIYIPQTVDYQSLALLSLLQNTDYSFRLIGNALDAKEYALMQAICDQSDRLECMNFESQHIIPHGTIVNMLHGMETSPLLCFMDSDVFIFEALQQSPAELIGKHHVFSSGGRIENDAEAIYAGFRGGAGTISPDGRIPLATTFFCIYQQQALQTCLQKYSVGFEQYRLWEQIPSAAQTIIQQQQLDFDMFDTSKLLSVLLHEMGYSKKYQPIDGLVHIGGMSGRYLQDMNLNEAVLIHDKDVPTIDQSLSTDEQGHQVRTERDIAVKRLLGRYFYIYLNHLIGKSNKPQIVSDDAHINTTVQSLESNMAAVFEQALHDPTQSAIINLIKHT